MTGAREQSNEIRPISEHWRLTSASLVVFTIFDSDPSHLTNKTQTFATNKQCTTPEMHQFNQWRKKIFKMSFLNQNG